MKLVRWHVARLPDALVDTLLIHFRYILMFDPKRWCVAKCLLRTNSIFNQLTWTTQNLNFGFVYQKMSASIVILKWFRGVWIHCDILSTVGTICPAKDSAKLNKEYTEHHFSFHMQAYLIISFQKRKKNADVSLNIVLTSIALYVNGSS